MKHRCHSSGFTLIEALLASVVLVCIVLFGYKFVHIAYQQKLNYQDTRNLHLSFSEILQCLQQDLSTLVTAYKAQPSFEMASNDDHSLFTITFFTSNSAHKTTALVQYRFQKITPGEHKITRVEVDGAHSLQCQKSLRTDSSLFELFESIPQEAKTTYTYPIPCSDFKIRLAIAGNNDFFYFLPPNVPLRYTGREVFYQTQNLPHTYRGKISFFDITLRGLTANDTRLLQKFLAEKHHRFSEKEFIFNNSCKAFRRIVIFSSIPF